MSESFTLDSTRVRRQFLSGLFSADALKESEVLAQKQEDICRTYNLVIVCPSHAKECGIGRYSIHAAEASRANYKAVHVLETTYQALRFARLAKDPCVVIFQHEYSLVDFQYDLGEDDTTSSVICNLSLIQQINPKNRTAIFMHSMFLTDYGLNKINKQIFCANIPIFHTNRDGCSKAHVNFTELGIPDFRVDKVPPLPKNFTVGAFGFLSPNKDVRSTLELCAKSGVYLRANYAPNNTGSPQSIREAQRHVEAQLKEMNVSAEVTFNFMSDEDLKEMVAETSIIYAPQHDFTHYATSASARFPLAVGRGAIVPPHRCFHDLAAGVQFAQLEEAVQIVRSMAANPAEAEKLAVMGLQYAKQNEIGRVYRSIGERLIENKVWCGGDPTGFRIPFKRRDIAERVGKLDGHDPWSLQNEEGLQNTGRGLRGGFFVYQDNEETSLADTFSDISFALDQSRDACELAEKIAALDRDISSDLRAYIGGNPPYISVAEFSTLPLYLKALVLSEIFGFGPDRAAKYAFRMKRNSGTDLMGNFIFSVDQLSRLAPDHMVDLEPLVWGHAVIRGIDRMKKIVYPGQILALPSENFITGVYRSFLRRDPEASAVENLRRALAMGTKKSDIACAIANSPEGREHGVEFAGSLEGWRSMEDEITSMIEMTYLIAPHSESIKSRNLYKKGIAYANVLD